MSSSINLNLTGVGDEIAAAVAEAMRKQLATFQCQTAGIIAKQVSEQVAAAIKTALPDSQKPTFDVREQILGTCLLDLFLSHSSLPISDNARAVLASYTGTANIGFDNGITIVVASYGESVAVHVVSPKKASKWEAQVIGLLDGPAASSDADALQGLFKVSKLAVTRAWDLRENHGGFRDLDQITRTA
jgi:hypothetical protein